MLWVIQVFALLESHVPIHSLAIDSQPTMVLAQDRYSIWMLNIVSNQVVLVDSQEVRDAGLIWLFFRLLGFERLNMNLNSSQLLLFFSLVYFILCFDAINELVFVSGDSLKLLLDLGLDRFSKLHVQGIDLIFVLRIFECLLFGIQFIELKVVAGGGNVLTVSV